MNNVSLLIIITKQTPQDDWDPEGKCTGSMYTLPYIYNKVEQLKQKYKTLSGSSNTIPPSSHTRLSLCTYDAVKSLYSLPLSQFPFSYFSTVFNIALGLPNHMSEFWVRVSCPVLKSMIVPAQNMETGSAKWVPHLNDI